MDISLIQIIQLWLYAAYCNLSLYTFNDSISKIRKSFTDQLVFQSIGSILRQEIFFAKAMTHTNGVQHLNAFSLLYIWHLSFFIQRNSVTSNTMYQHTEEKKLATVTVKRAAIICTVICFRDLVSQCHIM